MSFFDPCATTGGGFFLADVCSTASLFVFFLPDDLAAGSVGARRLSSSRSASNRSTDTDALILSAAPMAALRFEYRCSSSSESWAPPLPPTPPPRMLIDELLLVYVTVPRSLSITRSLYSYDTPLSETSAAEDGSIAAVVCAAQFGNQRWNFNSTASSNVAPAAAVPSRSWPSRSSRVWWSVGGKGGLAVSPGSSAGRSSCTSGVERPPDDSNSTASNSSGVLSKTALLPLPKRIRRVMTYDRLVR